MTLSGKVVSVLDGSTFIDGRERVSIRIAIPNVSSETIVIPQPVAIGGSVKFDLGEMVEIAITRAKGA